MGRIASKTAVEESAGSRRGVKSGEARGKRARRACARLMLICILIAAAIIGGTRFRASLRFPATRGEKESFGDVATDSSRASRSAEPLLGRVELVSQRFAYICVHMHIHMHWKGSRRGESFEHRRARKRPASLDPGYAFTRSRTPSMAAIKLHNYGR